MVLALLVEDFGRPVTLPTENFASSHTGDDTRLPSTRVCFRRVIRSPRDSYLMPESIEGCERLALLLIIFYIEHGGEFYCNIFQTQTV